LGKINLPGVKNEIKRSRIEKGMFIGMESRAAKPLPASEFQ